MYKDYERRVKQSKKEQREKQHVLSKSELLQKNNRACLFFTDLILKDKKVREALAWHAQCWEEDEVNPSVAAASGKNALPPRSEIVAHDRVEAAWSSPEEYFALNASIERVFQYSRSRFRSGPAHVITAELVAGLDPPEFETTVATALDMKKGWKENPDLVYLVARGAAEAWVTVE